MSQILIVDDESRISVFIAKGLKAAGYATVAVGTGTEAIGHAVSNRYDLMVLDLGLPDMDGFQVLNEIRGSGVTMPVIILTARDSVHDTVAGLEQGADDYMAKPFRFEELLARVRLRLRQEVSQSAAPELTGGDITLDLRTRRANVAGRSVELSAREFTLAETFLRHSDQVLSREQLLDMVWGMDFDPGSNVVDVYVRYLRKKLGDQYIETVRGMGYRLITSPHSTH